MNRFYYDLHIHSCLSPCGDDEQTPDSILGMGELNGLDIMALTDHNTCKNCPAFFKAAEKHGIVPVAGMELTTSEEIHIVCLFPTLEAASGFDCEVEKRRVLIKNRTDIFGNQFILDECDNKIGEEQYLLPNATEIPLEAVPDIVSAFGGVCYPAHVDRESNGIIAVLGLFPKEPHFDFIEVHDREKREQYASLCKKGTDRIITSSDAHYLWDISEKQNSIGLDTLSAQSLVEALGGRL